MNKLKNLHFNEYLILILASILIFILLLLLSDTLGVSYDLFFHVYVIFNSFQSLFASLITIAYNQRPFSLHDRSITRTHDIVKKNTAERFNYS